MKQKRHYTVGPPPIQPLPLTDDSRDDLRLANFAPGVIYDKFPRKDMVGRTIQVGNVCVMASTRPHQMLIVQVVGWTKRRIAVSLYDTAFTQIAAYKDFRRKPIRFVPAYNLVVIDYKRPEGHPRNRALHPIKRFSPCFLTIRKDFGLEPDDDP